MGLFHRATITPTKAETIAAWAPSQPWGPAAETPMEVVGAFRFDDPEFAVGIETHLVRFGAELFQVPLTYRNEPVAGNDAFLVGEMEHSALGTRWVYDGLGDDRYLTMLAAVTMTGQGEALGLAEVDGRWIMIPADVRIRGGGWGLERVTVDGFQLRSEAEGTTVFANGRFELSFARRPAAGPRPPIGLSATWDGQPEPVVLAEVTEVTER